MLEFVSSVRINKAGPYINNNTSRQITATASPTSATNRKVRWSTSNSNVLRVDQNGQVTAVNYGKATIYATSTDGSNVSDSYTLTVIRPVTRINLNRSTATMIEGDEISLRAEVLPTDATLRGVEWSSSDPTVAIVDVNENVTALKPGRVQITATSIDGNNISATCRITVNSFVPTTTVRINSSNVTLLSGQTRTLSARLLPTRTTESVLWVSADSSVATVSTNGTITARGQGVTQIYAISDVTGIESYCTVVVLAMNANSIVLEQYDNYILDVFGATEKVKWYTNNSRIATVDQNGKVVGRKAGTTTIVAKVNGKTLSCNVTVVEMKK